MTRQLHDRNYCLRLTELEDRSLAQLAQSIGQRTRARILRKMIREAIGEGPDLLKDDLSAFREAVRQVGAVGRNINQIARAINSGQVTGLPLDSGLLNNVLSRLSALEKELIEVVMRSRKRWVKHG